MSNPISRILSRATPAQLEAARQWMREHYPFATVTNSAAVSYIRCNFHQGELIGWDGFTKSLED